MLVAAGGVRDARVASLSALPPSLAVLFVASFIGVKAVAASALLTLPLQAAVAILFIARRLHFVVAELFAGTAWLAALVALEHPLLASLKDVAKGLSAAVSRAGGRRLARPR